MYSFIVLGIIPGTNVQITFTIWCLSCGLITAIIYAYKFGFKINLNSLADSDIDINKALHQ